MARRRRRSTRRKTPNLWFTAFQIVVLIALLIAVISVADSIGSGTSALVETLTSEDIQVRDHDARRESDFPGQMTDDQADTEPPTGDADRSDAGLGNVDVE